LRGKVNELEAIVPEKRMVYAHVDEQAVASVVSDWTGIPVGRMVADEVETVLNWRKSSIAGGGAVAWPVDDRQTHRDNGQTRHPNKPIGVFMLCGPSGVARPRQRSALAETLYGGEQT